MAIELFNGTILPDIPSEAFSSYYDCHYAVILDGTNHESAQTYILMVFHNEPYVLFDPTPFLYTTKGRLVVYYADADTWTPHATGLYERTSIDGLPIVWSNTDVKIATTDDSGNIIMTDVIYNYTSTGELVNYNGVMLPAIPNHMLLQYPNAVIVDCNKTDSIQGYVLAVCQSEPYVLFDDIEELSTDSEIAIYICQEGTNTWSYEGVDNGFSFPINFIEEPNFIIWSNAEIKIAQLDADGNKVFTDVVYDYNPDMVEYNGALYPSIQKHLTSMYPYAFALKYIGTDPDMEILADGYYIMLSKEKFIARNGSGNVEFTSAGSMCAYVYAPRVVSNHILSVAFMPAGEAPIGVIPNMTEMAWANQTIMYGVPYENAPNGIIETEIYYPPQTEESLPDVEHELAYIVPAALLESIASKVRKLTGNYTRMTIDTIDETLASIGSYKKIFNKTIEEIDFELPFSIAPYAFAYCTKLNAVSSDNVYVVGDSAFWDCTYLKSVSLPSAIEIGNSAFWSCESLESINLPNVTIIYDGGFRYCRKLKDICMPNVETIYAYVFDGCSSVQKIDLPSVTTLGGQWANCVFNECTNLTTLILRSNTVVTAQNNEDRMFYGTPIASGTGYIYVPSSLVDSYKADSNWSTYANQFRAIEDYPDVCGAIETATN